MQEPNPILGLHAAPGAVAWAQVHRGAGGAFRVLEWGAEHAPDDAAAAVARAAEISTRRQFRRRGAFLALPDGSGCLVTALLTPDEQDLDGEDLERELHEHTPFEPGAASLRCRVVRDQDRRRELVVAAIPSAQERRFADAAAPHDDGTVGLGFATAATVRGARALGLAGDYAFLVELLPRTTHVIALEGPRARRYLLSSGATEVIAAAARSCGRDADDVRRAVETGVVGAATQRALDAAAEDLADDVRGIVGYHQALDSRPKDAPTDAPVVPVGLLLGRAPLRRALAAHLGEGFASAAADPARIAWERAPGEAAISVAGAVGAAIEALDPAEARLALRPPPAEVSPPANARPWLWAAAVLVAGAAGAYWWQFGRPDTQAPPRPPDRTPPTTSLPAAEDPSRKESPPSPPSATAAKAPVLRVKSAGDGSVRLTWTGGDAGGAWALRRTDPGAAKGQDVATSVTAGPGDLTDHPPGASGSYRYRLVASGPGARDGDEIAVDVVVPVQVDLVRVDAGGSATFRLVRTWRGREVAADIAVAAGKGIATQTDVDGTPVTLASGLVFVAARVRDDVETVQVAVPEFGPDGRVVRAADGSVPRLLRDVRRTCRVHEADVLGASDGRRSTVSRKMTDG